MKRLPAIVICILFCIMQMEVSYGYNSFPVADFVYEIDGYNVTFNASLSYDDGYIVSYTWDFGDGEIGEGEEFTHEYEDEGLYTVCLTVIDNNGKSNSTCRIILIDVTSPYTSYELIPSPNGKNGWYISSVGVLLHAMDNLSGVNKTLYKINDGGWNEYEEIFYINENGEHEIKFYSIDNYSNEEIEKTVQIKIDKIAPSTTYITGKNKTNGWYRGLLYVMLIAADSHSGINSTFYRINGGEFKKYNETLLINEGMHVFEFFSVDNAGNVEKLHRLEMNVDSTPPDLKMITPSNSLYIYGREIMATESPIIIGNITIEAECIDNLAGVSKLELYIDKNYRGNATSPPYSWKWDEVVFGRYEILIKAYDRAGNTISVKKDVLAINLKKT